MFRTMGVVLVLLGALAATACRPHHGHQHGREIGPRVAVMSPEVLVRRLELMGYTDIEVLDVADAFLHVRATRAGQPVILEVGRRLEGPDIVPTRVERPDSLRPRSFQGGGIHSALPVVRL